MIKNWQIARAVLIGGGVIWGWSMLPTAFRPQIPNNPIRKSPQTVTIDVDRADESQVPWRAVGTVQSACKAPLLLRPIEGDADSVRVLLRHRDRIVANIVVPCKNEK